MTMAEPFIEVDTETAIKAIDALRTRYPDLEMLQGCELNIAADGSIDYDPGFLEGLGFGVASVHSAFDLDSDVQTQRVIAAMENPAVNVIGHLTGRKIGRRPGIDLDVAAVFDAAERTGTAIEINCHLDRLDASSEVLYLAREREVLFCISTDAHHTTELGNTRWGVANARRGWVERDRVVNTWPRDRFLSWVEAKRKG
jgi:DNA polymerase (family 10)